MLLSLLMSYTFTLLCALYVKAGDVFLAVCNNIMVLCSLPDSFGGLVFSPFDTDYVGTLKLLRLVLFLGPILTQTASSLFVDFTLCVSLYSFRVEPILNRLHRLPPWPLTTLSLSSTSLHLSFRLLQSQLVCFDTDQNIIVVQHWSSSGAC